MRALTIYFTNDDEDAKFISAISIKSHKQINIELIETAIYKAIEGLGYVIGPPDLLGDDDDGIDVNDIK